MASEPAPSSYPQQVTFLTTSDLEATRRFYEELLGLSLTLDQGSCHIYRVTTTSFLGFCQRDQSPSAAGVILTLVCDDVDARYQALEGRGARFELPPRHNPDYDIYHCFLRDPMGYLIEIQRFCDPRWPQPDNQES